MGVQRERDGGCRGRGMGGEEGEGLGGGGAGGVIIRFFSRSLALLTVSWV